MKYFLFLIPVLFLAGCESLPIFSSGNVKNQILAVAGVTVAGNYEVNIVKDGKLLWSEKWSCTAGEEGKLPECRKVKAEPAKKMIQ